MTVLHNIEVVAQGIGRQAYEAANRPAQEGDLLLFHVARDRTPINLVDWLYGYWDEPPAMPKLNQVVGDYDTVLFEHGQPITREWGKAFLASVVGAELVTFQTKDAFVLSKHAEPQNPIKRVKACLAEGLGIHLQLAARETLSRLAADLWQLSDQPARQALLDRYSDAPLLHGWVAPEYEPKLARDYVRCALAGGKAAGVRYRGVPDTIAIPRFSPA